MSKSDALGRARVYTVELSEMDMKIVLEALGYKQIRMAEKRLSTRAVEMVIERFYRAMGIRL